MTIFYATTGTNIDKSFIHPTVSALYAPHNLFYHVSQKAPGDDFLLAFNSIITR